MAMDFLLRCRKLKENNPLKKIWTQKKKDEFSGINIFWKLCGYGHGQSEKG